MKDLSASWVLENPINGDLDKLKGSQVLPFVFVKLVSSNGKVASL